MYSSWQCGPGLPATRRVDSVVVVVVVVVGVVLVDVVSLVDEDASSSSELSSGVLTVPSLTFLSAVDLVMLLVGDPANTEKHAGDKVTTLYCTIEKPQSLAPFFFLGVLRLLPFRVVLPSIVYYKLDDADGNVSVWIRSLFLTWRWR